MLEEATTLTAERPDVYTANSDSGDGCRSNHDCAATLGVAETVQLESSPLELPPSRLPNLSNDNGASHLEHDIDNDIEAQTLTGLHQEFSARCQSADISPVGRSISIGGSQVAYRMSDAPLDDNRIASQPSDPTPLHPETVDLQRWYSEFSIDSFCSYYNVWI